MKSRFKELFGMVLIGDGVSESNSAGTTHRDLEFGPEVYKTAARNLQKNPTLARVLGVGLLALGIALGRSAAKS
jgi:hypothetical protein